MLLPGSKPRFLGHKFHSIFTELTELHGSFISSSSMYVCMYVKLLRVITGIVAKIQAGRPVNKGWNPGKIRYGSLL
jgi:hypothetical protein